MFNYCFDCGCGLGKCYRTLTDMVVGISEAVIKAIAIAIGFAMVLVGMGGIL